MWDTTLGTAIDQHLAQRVALGLAQSQVGRQESIRELQKGRNFVQQQGLEEPGRELYFLALAYALAGDKVNAASTIQQIPEKSLFYSRAQTLREDLL